MCVLIPSPVSVRALFFGASGDFNGGLFFEFELKLTGMDSADTIQHEFLAPHRGIHPLTKPSANYIIIFFFGGGGQNYFHYTELHCTGQHDNMLD